MGLYAGLRQIGEAVVRHALLALIDVVQRRLGALLEVVDHGRRDAPALGPDLVAGRRVDVLAQSAWMRPDMLPLLPLASTTSR